VGSVFRDKPTAHLQSWPLRPRCGAATEGADQGTARAYGKLRLTSHCGRFGLTHNQLPVRPNVRAKRATTAWRAGQQAQNGPKAQRLMAGVACRWRSA